MKAEFVATSETSRDLLGIHEMLGEVNTVPSLPMLMHADSQASIKQIEGEASSIKAKHVDVCLKCVCDSARRGIVIAQYMRSVKMLADLLIKALDPAKLASLLALMRLDY